MTPEDRKALREILAKQPDGTHYEGCWEYHGWCAVSYLLDDYEVLLESWNDLLEKYEWQ